MNYVEVVHVLQAVRNVDQLDDKDKLVEPVLSQVYTCHVQARLGSHAYPSQRTH